MNNFGSSTWYLGVALLVAETVCGQSEMMMFQSKVPQAQSRQELTAFLDLIEVSAPSEILPLITRFRERFRNSEFIPETYRMEMKAHKMLGDYQRAIEAGEQALKRNAADLDTMLTVANMLPDGVDSPRSGAENLLKAERYALRGLEEIASLKVPRTVSLPDWQKLAAQMKASAHSALGLIALKRGQYPESIVHLEMCTSLNPIAEGAQYYMLGVAYFLNRKYAEAKAALERASKLGPEMVKSRADKHLATLGKEP